MNRPGIIASCCASWSVLNGAPIAVYNNVLHDPKMRDPRGFILPADQPDFLTATKFVNTLIKGGVVAHRATAAFTVAGKQYPAGSYVFKAAQPFRAHLMDMFEPQDHPDDIPYPGGAPRPPYDVTGYNIAYSMGIKFDRILDGFDGPFEKIPDLAPVPAGRITAAPAGGGCGRGWAPRARRSAWPTRAGGWPSGPGGGSPGCRWQPSPCAAGSARRVRAPDPPDASPADRR